MCEVWAQSLLAHHAITYVYREVNSIQYNLINIAITYSHNLFS